MKFGKQLESQSLPKFRGYYVQYKELKKAIKVFTGHDKDQATVEEVTHWTSSFLRLGPNPEVGPEARLQEILGKERDRVCRFCELEAEVLKKKLDTLKDDCENSQETLEELRQRLDQVGKEIVQLKVFTSLNFSGFRKLLKKYDKWGRSNVLPWFMSQVARSSMMTIDFDDMLSRLNRVAMYLGSRAPAEATTDETSRRPPPFHWGPEVRELVFLVDTKDTMWVKVELAKTLGVESTAALQGRTTCVFFDTPELDVYQSHVQRTKKAAPPSTSAHLRHAGGEVVCLAYDEEGQVRGTEVLVPRSEAERLAAGEAVRVPTPVASSTSASAGTRQQVAGDVGREVCSRAQRYVREHGAQPLAQASYARRVFSDGVTCLKVALDEDIRLAKTGKLDAQAVGSQSFPSDVLTISVSEEARSKDVPPKWLQQLYDGADLFEVSGFSKAAHAVAHFFAKERDLVQMPHWYDRVMNIEKSPSETSKPSSDKDGAGVMEAQAPADPIMSVVPQSGLQNPAMRLLHEFGRSVSPREAQPQGGVTPRSSRPADDTVGVSDLAAPLLDTEGQKEEASGFEPIVEAAPAGKWSSFSRFLRRRLFGGKQREALPVRVAIVAVQPKTLYSNERTYLEWMHFATLFGALGFGSLHAARTATEVAEARFLVVCSICIVLWSLRTFSWRAEALENKEIREYHDSVGPPAIVLIFLTILTCSSLHALGILNIGDDYQARLQKAR